MSDSASAFSLTVHFRAAEMEAIDAWIARHDDPKPSREDAVRQLVAGRLGVDEEGHMSTVLPNMITGRDII